MMRRPSLSSTIAGSLLLLMLHGCATPLDIGGADRDMTPQAAVKTFPANKDRAVAWGGSVVNAKNLADTTQFEVVGYPLDSNNRPNTQAAPLGRFIVVHPGYLETADYAPGRVITVVGNLTETRSGKVGEATYVYPVVAANRVHLWPIETPASSEPRIHFGIGIGIIR